MYSYFVYNCYVQSDFPLYNLPQQSGDAEIFIKNESFERPAEAQSGGQAYYSPELVYFQTEFGEFCVKGGNTILVHPEPDADLLLVASIIIGYGFAFLFSQRGATAFHCTALGMFDKGVLISGVSGAGKSTTAYHLINRGHKYMADDMAMMYPQEHALIMPAYPIQKICGVDIGTIPQDRLLYINEMRDKYSYYNSEQYESTPKRITTMFCLVPGDVDEVTVVEQKGFEKYLRVLECQFLAEKYCKIGTPDRDKQNCLKLASMIRFYKIIRPVGKDTVSQIVEVIENIVREA